MSCQLSEIFRYSENVPFPPLSATIYELEIIFDELKSLIRDTKKYAKDEYLPKNLLAVLDSAYIRRQPYGVVLVLGAWSES